MKSGLEGYAAATDKKFAAHMLGLKDVYFTLGAAKDTAMFEEMVSALAWHVGTQPSKHSSLASKAMSFLAKPTTVAPA